MATKPMPRIRAGMSGAPLTSVVEPKKHISMSNKLKIEDKSTVSASFDKFNYVSVTNTVPNDNFVQNEVKKSPETFENCEIPTHNKTDESDKNIFGIMTKDLEQNEIKPEAMDTTKVENNEEGELERIKQLMMLQVSLIGRQQDLLKLRDKEILKLKTTNQALKSRMDRMGRRISLSRRNSLDPINALLDATSEQQNNEKKTFDDLQMTTDLGLSRGTQKTIDPGLKPINLPQNVDNCSTPVSKPSKKRKKSRNENPDKTNDSSKNISLFSPIKSPSGQNHIPVPISFIERCQNELISSFTNPLITKDGTSLDSNLGLKICERCPHCTVMAAEITQLIMMANNSDLNSSSADSVKVATDLNEEVIVQPVVADKPETKTAKKAEVKKLLLRTPHPYHREHLFHNINNFPIMVEWNDVKSKDSMLIPTWRLNEIKTNVENTIDPSTSRIEDTTDDTYTKRHTKFELNEKRRKRWDIQRIREFRYNEKLRQNLLNKEQQESGFLESFLPTLYDIDKVEIKEDFPINCFGYSIPSLTQSEFKLPWNANVQKKT